MTKFKRFMAVLTLGAVGTGSWYVGSNLFQNVRFAQAKEEVAIAKQHLAQLEDLAGVYKAVGKAVEPSVVFLEVTKKSTRSDRRTLPFDDETLRRFFPDRDGDGEPDLPQQDEGSDAVAQGSGVIIEAEGDTAWILTNNHVAADASELRVTLNDGREIRGATVVGTDPKTDLAVVKIEAKRVIAANWGDSEKLEKGDIVMAFGAPFGYVGSMTHGIVSALNRQAGILGQAGYENFIQVDCPINPGNSGGPLVNVRGEVVGINTAILSRNGGFQGIGFSIPSNQAKFVYAQLKQTGKVTRGWLGVSISDVTRQPGLAESFGYTASKGVLVNEAMADGPADGKLHNGDIIMSADGNATDTMQALRNYIATIKPGNPVKLKIWRDKKEQEVEVKIGEQPENPFLARSGGGGREGVEGGAASAEKLGLKLADPTAAQLERFGLEAEQGALVTGVNRNSPAFDAGLRAGDLITQIGEQRVSNSREAAESIASQNLKKGVRLYVSNREGKRFVFLKDE